MTGKKSTKRGSSKQQYKPKGIGLLWNYNALVAFLFLFLVFATDSALLFGISLNGKVAKLVHLAYFVTFMTIIFGLTFKRQFVYRLMVFAYTYWIANSVISFISLIAIDEQMIKSFYFTISPVILFFLFINSIILWYVYEKKSYFLLQIGHSDIVDKFFKRVMLLFYVSFFFFIGFVLLQRMALAPHYEMMSENFEGLEKNELANLCNSLKDPNMQDACTLYAIDEYGELPKYSITCEIISSGIHRYDCYRMNRYE